MDKIKQGYKQTELGVIPEDWGVETIDSLCKISTGGKNTQDKISNGKYPFFVRSQKIERINSYSYDGEAVLTAGDGVGTGKIFHYIDGKFDYHQRVYSMTSFANNISGKYFYRAFSNYFFDRIMSMTAKSSVDSVRREMIADMYLSVPPKKEQEAIAGALSDVDELILSLEKLISKKQNIKQATMNSILSSGILFKKGKLEDFFTVNKGKALSSKDLEHGFYPVVAGGKSSPYKHKFYTHNKEVITVSASGAYAGFVWYHNYPIWASDCSVITSKKDSLLFLSYYLKFYQSFIYDMQTGGAQPHIYPEDLRKMGISLPKDVNEQKRIASILSDMDAEIDGLKARLEKTKMLKQGMMEDLLTGKTRIL